MPKRKLTERNVKKIHENLEHVEWFENVPKNSVNDMLESFHGKLISILD